MKATAQPYQAKFQSGLQSWATWLIILFPLVMLAGKSIADLASIVLSALFITRVVMTRDYSFLYERWVACALMLLIYLAARGLFVPHIAGAESKVLPAIRFILFAAALQHFVSHADKSFNKKLIIAVLAALGFLVVDGFIQFFSGKDLFGRQAVAHFYPNFAEPVYRLTGPFSKMILGTTVAFLAALGLTGWLPSMLSGWRRCVFACSLFSVFILLLFTGERGAMLQFTVTVAVVAATLFLKYSNAGLNRVASCLLFGSAVALTTLLCIVHWLYPQIIMRQFGLIAQALTNIKLSHHLYLWGKGLQAGWHSPIFGIGPHQFEIFCNASRQSEAEFICSQHPHNIFIEFFAEGGLVGLALFIALVWALVTKFVGAIRSTQNLALVSLILGAGMAAFQRMLLFIPSSSFFKSWFAIPIWFAVGLMLGWIRQIERKDTRKM